MKPPAASHRIASASPSSSRPWSSGLNTSGPRIAPNTAPNSTSAIPCARRSGGYMSPAAARASSAVPLAAPTPVRPTSTAGAESTALPSAASPQPADPTTKPSASTGTRPTRSIARPAGSAASAPEASTIAGPRPSRPSTPTTETSVSEATAADSCSVPELAASAADSSAVLRRMCSSARVVTLRQASRVSTPPATGLGAIDPAPFLLRHEPAAVPAGAGLDAVRLDRRISPFGKGLNVRSPRASCAGCAAASSGTARTATPRTGIRRASTAAADILLVSWYSKSTGAARLSVVDTKAGRYGHVALVTKDGKPVKTHAGGLAWREHMLYVTDTKGGLRLFDLRCFAGDSLPQAGWYRPAGEALRFSYASVDAAAGGLLVGEYTDKKPGARLVRWPLAPGGLLAQEPASDAWVTAHANIQGAIALGGKMLMAASRGPIREGKLTSSPFAAEAGHRRWAIGCEDLASVGGDVVSLSEHPDLPWPLAAAATVYRAEAP